jgi:HAD superfamily hydrolase (TIGR01509 family)
VVFDLDGVLVMSEHLWEESWRAYAARYGYSWTPHDTRSCQGMSVAEWGAYLATRSSGDVEGAVEAVVATVVESYRSGAVTLIDGAVELVAAVAARVPVGLASSAPREIIDTVMETMGIGPYFSATVSSAEVARGKPSPDVYAEAVNRLGIDAARSVAVEDSSNGVRAAAAAGLTVVAVAHDRYPLAPDAVAVSHSVRTTLSQVRTDVERLLDERAVGGRTR